MFALQVAALSTGGHVALFVGAGVAVWFGLAGMTASYGSNRGFAFFPLFVCAIFVGFPVVLLAVPIGDGLAHRRER